MSYKIVALKSSDADLIKLFYEWQKCEEHFEYFSCRPIKEVATFTAYKESISKSIKAGNITYCLVAADESILGKIVLFDHNKRNKSVEFGYYFPEENRGKGFGLILIKLFIAEVFNHDVLDINKIYATTASNNFASIKILEKCDFHLDGIMRQHYWINEKKYDQHVYSLLKEEWHTN